MTYEWGFEVHKLIDLLKQVSKLIDTSRDAYNTKLHLTAVISSHVSAKHGEQ